MTCGPEHRVEAEKAKGKLEKKTNTPGAEDWRDRRDKKRWMFQVLRGIPTVESPSTYESIISSVC